MYIWAFQMRHALQHWDTHCNTETRTTVAATLCSNTLLHSATTHCYTLQQHTATLCNNTLNRWLQLQQYTAATDSIFGCNWFCIWLQLNSYLVCTPRPFPILRHALQHWDTHCNTETRTATLRHALQHWDTSHLEYSKLSILKIGYSQNWVFSHLEYSKLQISRWDTRWDTICIPNYSRWDTICNTETRTATLRHTLQHWDTHCNTETHTATLRHVSCQIWELHACSRTFLWKKVLLTDVEKSVCCGVCHSALQHVGDSFVTGCGTVFFEKASMCCLRSKSQCFAVCVTI